MPYGFAPAIGEGLAIERVTQRTPRPHHTYTNTTLRPPPPSKTPHNGTKGAKGYGHTAPPLKRRERGAEWRERGNGKQRRGKDGRREAEHTPTSTPPPRKGTPTRDARHSPTSTRAPCHRARPCAPCALPVMLPPCHPLPRLTPHATPPALRHCTDAPHLDAAPPYAPRLLAHFTRPTDATPAPLVRA